jgi:hypothetical protein
MKNYLPLGVVVLWSCMSPSEPELGPHGVDSPVQTDSLEYTLLRVPGGYQALARAVYVNRTGRELHFARCTPDHDGPIFNLQRATSVTTQSVVGGAWACVGGVPTGRLPAGDSVVVNVGLGSWDSPHANPPITMSMRTGLFRVVLQLCQDHAADSVGCRLLPIEQRRSSIFRINPPD